MKKSHRLTALSIVATLVILILLVKFALLPWLQVQRDLQARKDAQRTLAVLVLAEKRFSAKNGHYTDSLTALKPWLSKLPANQKLHFGFNPACLQASGAGNSIGSAASAELTQTLQGMFAELPCATERDFTAMVAVRTSRQLEIFISHPQAEIASMALSDRAGEGLLELASFRTLLASLREAPPQKSELSRGSVSGSTSQARP